MKKLTSLQRLENELIHSPFYRSEVRDGDGVGAEIQINGQWIKLKVWYYTPFGVELVVPAELKLATGDQFSLKLIFRDDEILHDAIHVATLEESEIGTIVGFKTFTRPESRNIQEDRRKNTRWTCSQTFLPTGTAPNPMSYNDHIIFRVDDISAGGLRLLTSMRNKLVYEGLVLESSISIPLVGSISTPLKIEYIDVVTRGDSQIMSLGVSFVKSSDFLMKCLAEYLLHFGQDVTVATLQKDGFPVVANLKTFDFSYVKTKWEYEKVLELRRTAYLSAGKIPTSTRPEDMKDRYDDRARILIVKKGDDVVGTLRVMFHEKYQDSELHTDGVFNVPDIDHRSAVELSRLCTHPDFRGVDIAYTLVAHMYLTAIKAGKRYCYAGATGTMLDFYKTLGWTIHDTSYSCSSLKGIPHKIISVDLYTAVLGRGVKAGVWKRVYKTLYEYLYERGVVVPNTVDSLRLQVFDLLP